jgi:hypothetical protein
MASASPSATATYCTFADTHSTTTAYFPVATAERHGAGRPCGRAERDCRREREDLPPHRSLSSYQF